MLDIDEADEPELQILPFICTKDGVFVDIGAHEGVYAQRAAPLSRSVYIFEPNPDSAASIRELFGGSARVFETALSDSSGRGTFYIPTRQDDDVATRGSLQQSANPGFALRRIEVDITTLDSHAVDNVAVIKIDVEGHELAVLRGCRGTLQAQTPALIVECEERHNAGAISAVFGYLSALGYRSFFIHRGRVRDGSDFDLTYQRDTNAKPVGAAKSPDYINNFIFVHPRRPADFHALIRQYNLSPLD